jgi:hypothetical protein
LDIYYIRDFRPERRLAGEECSHNRLALKYSNILDDLGYLAISSKASRILLMQTRNLLECLVNQPPKPL